LPPRGPGGGGPNFIFFPEFLLFLFRSPCKNLKSYNNPFWCFEQRYRFREIYSGSVRLYSGSVRLYSGSGRLYSGSVRKYSRKNVVKIVAYLSCSAGRTHFARTNTPELFSGSTKHKVQTKLKMSLDYKTHSPLFWPRPS
jgi:X-X-X-Leu-X-X-Gly heptad repeat protein